MKKRNLVFSILISLLFFTACSTDNKDFLFGGKSDPLADKDNTMEEGTEQPSVPVSEKPVPSESVKIDTVEFYSFTVGTKDEFKIGVRALLADYTTEIQIANMNEFPGATYDAATGIFSWNPSAELMTGVEMYTDLTLQVRAFATKPAEPNKPENAVLMAIRDVNIRINRLLLEPEIVSINMNSLTSLREGSLGNITVEINDPNATTDKATWPTLLISGPISHSSLSAFTSISSVTQLANNHIQLNLEIDLRTAELTKSQETMGLLFKAVSMFNKVSAEQKATLSILNKLENQQTTWTQGIEVVAGTKLDYQFMIFDPKSEGKLGTPIFSGLPTDVKVTCTYVTASMQSCRLLWDIPATQKDEHFSFSAATELKNVYSYDSVTNRMTFHYWVNVKAATPVP